MASAPGLSAAGATIRISDLIDSYPRPVHRRDGRLPLNRLEPAQLGDEELTIATIFLPLTFITGFFGQNYDWMVGHIRSLPVFLGLGIGSELVAILALVAFFKRRRWFCSRTQI